MNCKRCGNLLNNDAVFCPMCGEKNVQIDDKKNKKDNKKIIVFVIIGILLVICGVYIFHSLSNNDNIPSEDNNNEIGVNNSVTDKENDNNETDTNNSVTNQEKEDDDLLEEYTFNLFQPSKIEKIASKDNDLTKNVVIEEIFFNPNSSSYGSTRDAYVYGKNNNSTMVTVTVVIEYYDSEGYRIERRTNLGCKVAAGKEFVTSLYIENDSLNYSKVKLSYEANQIKSYETEIDLNKVESTHYLIDDLGLSNNIKIITKNTSNNHISAGNYACLYYKENKLVFASYAYLSSMEPGQTKESTCYERNLYLNDDYKDRKKIEYDDYKVVLYSLYDSDSTNY